MYQLAITVMAVALAAIVVAGGGGYLSSDIGNRTKTAAEASGGLAVMGAAASSYRAANSGLLPRLGGAWLEDLAPYLPGGRPPRVSGMSWSYVAGPGGRSICLSTDGPKASSAVSGLRQASTGLAGSSLVASCASSAPVPDGVAAAAVVLRLEP